MEAVFALADRITVLVYGRVIASGAPDCDPRQRRGAPSLSRRAGGGAWLSAAARGRRHRDRYGLSQVLFGISLAIRAGEMVTLMGRNGMGKTTTVRSIMGLTPRDWPARSASAARRSRACRLSHRAARHRPGAGRAPDFPEPHDARKSGGDGGQLGKARPIRGRSTRSASCFRASPSALNSMGNQLVRRRAADAGHRPRADDQSAPAHPRRSDRRPRAADPRRDLALPDAAQGQPGNRSW